MMATVRIGFTQSAMSAASFRSIGCINASGALSNEPPEHVYGLPEWKRHGTQPAYWSEMWHRKERLADWDRIAGTIHEVDDIEDLIRDLDEAANAAQAD